MKLRLLFLDNELLEPRKNIIRVCRKIYIESIPITPGVRILLLVIVVLRVVVVILVGRFIISLRTILLMII